MLHNDKITLKGKIEIIKKGKVEKTFYNAIVYVGRELLFNRLKDNTEDFLDYIAVGTDDTAVTLSDTTLGAELDRRQATNKTATSDSLIIETEYNVAEGVGYWKEVGVFNDASAGTMFNRAIIDYDNTGTELILLRITFNYI